MNEDLPRIGIGTDLHRLEAGRPCILGAVTFDDCPVGPVGHSDGDAVLHAICDALLGAAGLDDLGTLFRDDDAANAGRASRDFIAEALRQLGEKQLKPISLDLVVHCDRPKLRPRRTEMRRAIGELLAMPFDRVNLKGKTLEGTRRDVETVSVTAVVLLAKA